MAGHGAVRTIVPLPPSRRAEQHFWTGGLETAGPGCYDAVAIARAAGFRMLAGYEPHPSRGDCPLTTRSRAKRAARIPKNRCRTTVAEADSGTLAELPFIGVQVGLLKPRPSRP